MRYLRETEGGGKPSFSSKQGRNSLHPQGLQTGWVELRFLVLTHQTKVRAGFTLSDIVRFLFLRHHRECLRWKKSASSICRIRVAAGAPWS